MADRRLSYKKIRKSFSIRVHIIFVVFLCLSALQWFLMFFINNDTHKAFAGKDFIPVMMFGIALLLILLFIFIEPLRFVACLNLLITFLIFESMVIAIIGIGIYIENIHFLIAFVIAIIVMGIFIILGQIIIHDFTSDVVILFVIFFALFTMTIYFSLTASILNSRLSYFIYCFIIGFIVICFVMYHAQAVKGERYAEMRPNDFYLAALIYYCQYIALLLIFLYIDSRMYGDYQDNKPPPTKKAMGETK